MFSHGADSALGQVLKSIKGVKLSQMSGDVPKPWLRVEFLCCLNLINDDLAV